MSLSPLLQAPVLFGIHAGMALTAFVTLIVLPFAVMHARRGAFRVTPGR